MKNAIFIILGIFIIILCYYLFSFELFPVEKYRIKEISLPNKQYKIRLDYLPSNATSQDYIQVNKAKNGNEEVLKNYDRHNFVNSYSLINDSTLQLVLCDTMIVPDKLDTFLLPLPK